MANFASELRQHLDLWESHQYDFYWHVDPVTLLYRKHQQDALRANWEGLVSRTDGGVDKRSDRMGAG